MRVAIVAPSPVPFTRGGAERAWDGLHRAIGDHTDHDAELLKLPIQEDTLPHLIEGYRSFAAMDVSHFDLVVTSKYPAWIVPHANHVVWMFHPLRGLYDTYNTFGLPTRADPGEPVLRDLLRLLGRRPERTALDDCFASWDAAVVALGPDHPALTLPSPLARALVHWLDRVALSPAEVVRHLALSRTVAGRIGYFPRGVAATVTYAPADIARPPNRSARSQVPRPIFTTSRLDHPKRIDLLIGAMAFVPGPTPLLIGGTGPAEHELRTLARGDDRIRFLGFVPEEELAERYTRALAVPFVPADEDLGLITLEAMSCGTPVVTCTDSGGPTEFVVDGVTGAVVEPDAAALGQALAGLVADPAGAAKMGCEAQRRVARITWPAAVATILGRRRPVLRLADTPAGAGQAPVTAEGRPSPASATAGSRRRRPRVVVTTTFAVGNPRHGGQLRCFHLYGALARHIDVDILSLVDHAADIGTRQLGPGLREIGVARSPAHRRVGEGVSVEAGMPVTDIVAGTDVSYSPAYLERLREALRGASAVILAEPYMLPAVEAVGAIVPRVYDAFNVEADLKAEVLPGSRLGRRLLHQVQDLERRAVLDSKAITTCSNEDAQRLAVTHGRRLDDFTVVPNGTDCRFTVPSPEARRDGRDRWLRRWGAQQPLRRCRYLAVFFASWHPPNLDAAEILLWLAPQLPEVQFVLGGNHGDAFVGRTPPQNLVFTGVIGDLSKRALLAAADVALNPMLSGSGTNLKVIEYLAAGVPVISTAFGVRGLAAIDGAQLLVAEPAEMSTAVSRLLADPTTAAERAVAGRALALEHYDWRKLGDRLAGVIDRAIAGHRSSRTVALRR